MYDEVFLIQRIISVVRLINMLFKISLLPRNQEMPQAMETECPPEELVFNNCVSGGLFFKGIKIRVSEALPESLVGEF